VPPRHYLIILFFKDQIKLYHTITIMSTISFQKWSRILSIVSI